MTTLSRENLIKLRGEEQVTRIEGYLADFITYGYLVIPWDEAPQNLRNFFDEAGGDEDYILIRKGEDGRLPYFLERMSPFYDLDTYCLNGIFVYVGSH